MACCSLFLSSIQYLGKYGRVSSGTGRLPGVVRMGPALWWPPIARVWLCRREGTTQPGAAEKWLGRCRAGGDSPPSPPANIVNFQIPAAPLSMPSNAFVCWSTVLAAVYHTKIWYNDWCCIKAVWSVCKKISFHIQPLNFLHLQRCCLRGIKLTVSVAVAHISLWSVTSGTSVCHTFRSWPFLPLANFFCLNN